MKKQKLPNLAEVAGSNARIADKLAQKKPLSKEERLVIIEKLSSDVHRQAVPADAECDSCKKDYSESDYQDIRKMLSDLKRDGWTAYAGTETEKGYCYCPDCKNKSDF